MRSSKSEGRAFLRWAGHAIARALRDHPQAAGHGRIPADHLAPDALLRAFRASRFHSVSIDDGGLVRSIEPIHSSDVWVNGGYFCLRNDVFDAMQEGEELVEKPFQRLLAQGKVSARKHEGFWAAMDTFKDKITLDRM